MNLFRLGESSISLDPKDVGILYSNSSYYFWDTENIISSKIITNGFCCKIIFHKGWIQVLESFVNL